jgi:6-phosphogluconolactonase (cycloisomerase 2 family)
LVLPPFINGAMDAVLDPLGRFAYSASFDAPSLASFSYSAVPLHTRELVLAPGSPVDTWPAGTEAYVTADPTGKFIFTCNEDAFQVKAFAVNQTTAALTLVNALSTNRPPASVSPVGLVVDPAGKFLYVGLKNGTIQAYAINAVTGALTGVADFTSLGGPTGGSSGGLALSMAMDASGRFLYFVNYSAGKISAFNVNSITGLLSEVTPLYSPANSVQGIVIP